jgi:dolichol-phosphate mannosyltransferase
VSAERLLVSVIVPLFNEERVVPELCRRLHAALAGLDGSYEVIIVDDGSADETYARAVDEHRRDPRVKVLGLSRNFGHQVALSAALDRVRGTMTVMMDGDLEDPPELIPALIAKAGEGWDVVYAVKRSRREGLPKRLAFRAFHTLLRRVADIDVPEGAGNFSLMSERVVRVMRTMPERARYLSGLRAWVGYRQTALEFDRDERYDRRPRMSVRRLFALATDAIFGFSHLPLRLALYVGTLVSLGSLAVGLWVLYERLFTDHAITGWASTIVSINFIGGTILLTLGVIGEYVGRIYDEVKSRPLYVLRDEVGFDARRDP